MVPSKNENVLLTELNNGVRTIKINRPHKKNAMSRDVYLQITKILNEDAVNDGVVVTILTGVGEYYSSGNDLTDAFNQANEGNSETSLKMIHDFVQAFISYPKLLIAVVNGPAIGIAATTLALCDIVYCSDTATFTTPFLRLGLCAEAASSYTFPLRLGRSKASEMLFLGKTLTAREAYDSGFVSKIVDRNKVDNLIAELHKYGTLPVNSLKINKKLIQQGFGNILCECNTREVKALETCISSEEFGNAVALYLSNKTNKSKL